MRFLPSFSSSRTSFFLGLLLVHAKRGTAQQTSVFINEIHYDNSGADENEAIEVAGPVGTNFLGFTLILYNGNGGAQYDSFDVGSFTPSQDGCVVFVTVSTPGIQNGSPDGVALVDPDGTVVQFLSYEGAFTAIGGAADGLTSTDVGVSESSPTAATESLQLTGTGRVYEDFTWASPAMATFNGVNDGQIFTCSEPPPEEGECTSIPSIQGTGSESPLKGQNVKVCGVYVTAIVFNGFYVQEDLNSGDSSTSSSSPMASSGIFVFTGATPSDIVVGDPVDVVGTVQEFFDLTELTSVTYTKLDVGQVFVAATPLVLPLDSIDDFERYESMLVSVQANGMSPSSLVVSEYFNLDRFGEVKVCAVPNEKGRPYQFAQLNAPDATGYAAHLDLLSRTCVFVDDNNGDQNPNPVEFGGIYPIDTADTLRGGTEVTTLVGPLFFSFGFWRVQPRSAADLVYNDANPRPTSPPNLNRDDSSSVTVASANVLNYFTTIADNDASCYARGADSDLEFSRQSEKTVLALSELNADVYGLVEVENFPGLASLDLARRLNELNPSRGYVPVSQKAGLTAIGRDFIRVEILYDANVLELVGAATLTDDQVKQTLRDASSEGVIFNGRNRVPLAAQFRKSLGGYLTVINNHFKSKGGSSSATGADSDQGDGAGAFNGVRKLAAQALLDWMSEEKLFRRTKNILIMGDLNAYAKEDPVQLLFDNGFKSGEELFPTDLPPEYSYLFDGQFGTLDYILAKDDVEVFGAGVWHINADEPDLLDYNLNFGRDSSIFDGSVPFRFADHDPIVASIGVRG